MARSRMMNGDEPAATPSPRTTIVGGRPPEKDAQLPPVPTGIQRLLRLASIDPAFRRELVARRGEVAEAAQVPLSPSEAAILKALPDQHLEDMAAKMPPPSQGRRDFLRQTAATAVVLLGGAALSEAVSGCDKPPTDPAPSRPEQTNPSAVAGVSPDMPPESAEDAGTDTPSRPDDNEMQPEGGAAPDLPPPRPETSIKTRGVSHDVPPPRASDRPMGTKGGTDPSMPGDD